MNALGKLIARIPLGKKWKTTSGLMLAALAALAKSLGWIDVATADAFLTAGLGLAGVGVMHRDVRETQETN